MKKNLVFLLILVFSSFYTFFIEGKGGGEEEKKQVSFFSSTFDYFSHQNSEKVWPFFSLLSYPAILHFENGHMYAFGLSSSFSHWTTFSVSPFRVLFRVDKKNPLLNYSLNPFYVIEGQPFFIFGLKEKEDPFDQLFTFIREKFYLFQSSTFKVKKTQAAKDRDYQKITQLVWIELENRLLKQALEAFSLEERKNFLQDYVAVNQTRRQQLSRQSIEQEDHYQQKEGLAGYVSLKTYQVFPVIANFNFEQAIVKQRQQKLAEKPSLIYDAKNTRHGFVGASLAWALDLYASSRWKYAVQYHQFTLQQLLDRSLALSLTERHKRLAKLKSQVEWKILFDEIRLKLEKEKINDKLIIDLFNCQGGFQEEIIIWLAPPPKALYTRSYQHSTSFLHHLKILKEANLLSTTHDSLWKFCFKNISLYAEEPMGEYVFKLPVKVKMFIDGQELAFKTMQQLPQPIVFRSLSWKSSLCDLETSYPGKIFTYPHAIQISFDEN